VKAIGFGVMILAQCCYGYPRIDYDYMDHIQQQIIVEVCDKYDCACCGLGGAAFYDIEKFKLTFQFNNNYSENEIREILVNISNIFVEKINQHQKIRPFLREYPFSLLRCEYILIFPNKDNAICMSLNANNKFYMYKYIKEKNDSIRYLEETYEAAVQKLKVARESI
jgi:hypothetical protein